MTIATDTVDDSSEWYQCRINAASISVAAAPRDRCNDVTPVIIAELEQTLDSAIVVTSIMVHRSWFIDHGSSIMVTSISTLSDSTRLSIVARCEARVTKSIHHLASSCGVTTSKMAPCISVLFDVRGRSTATSPKCLHTHMARPGEVGEAGVSNDGCLPIDQSDLVRYW